MRHYLVILLLVSIFTTNAQQHFNSQNKFSIQLPDEFKGNRKLLMKIVEIVQFAVPKLKDKQECLNCDADFWANFYVVSPTIQSISNKAGTSQFLTLYSFTAFMDVYDKNYTLIKRVYFTDSNNTLSHNTFANATVAWPQNSITNIKAAADISASMIQANYNTLNTTRDLARIEALRESINGNFDADKYIKTNRSNLIPTANTLWNVVQNIILDIKLPKTE